MDGQPDNTMPLATDIAGTEGIKALLDLIVLPLVLGKIQVTAQWILRGQPLKTLEKQAPIYRTSTANESLMVCHGFIDIHFNKKHV